jgi:predicted O-methyltransferase YrrM
MQGELCDRIALTLSTGQIHDPHGYEALACLKLPGPSYLSVLRTLHLALKPKLYVEIGVRLGTSLMQADPETRCIAIDPAPAWPLVPKRPNIQYNISTSDGFFAREEKREACRGFDLAFIDGDHSFAQAAKDFENLEKLAGPTSIIAIHDVIPMDEKTAQAEAASPEGFHTGDVWRLMREIVRWRRDLVAFTIACAPSGLGIVGRFGSYSYGTGTTAWYQRSEPEPYTHDWTVQTRMLNIIPNEPDAIRAAFAGGDHVRI